MSKKKHKKKHKKQHARRRPKSSSWEPGSPASAVRRSSRNATTCTSPCSTSTTTTSSCRSCTRSRPINCSPTDVAMDLRQEFRKHQRVSVKLGEVASIDPAARSVTLADGGTFAGDFIVLAAGSQANFFDTPGAEHVFPLYSLDDAERLRSRVLAIFEDADRDPSLVEKGALNIVVVGAGATGTEVAGAIAELVRDVLPSEFHDLAVDEARVIVVDLGDAVLGPFSPKAHDYASKVLLGPRGRAPLGDVGEGDRTGPRGAVGRFDDPHALRHLGRRLEGGSARRHLGPQAGTRRADRRRKPDLTVADHPGIYAVGDIANIARCAGSPVPAAGIGRVAGRKRGGRQHRRGYRRQASREPSTTTTRGSWR